MLRVMICSMLIVTPLHAIRGDLDRDGDVDYDDFFILADNFGQSGGLPEVDYFSGIRRIESGGWDISFPAIGQVDTDFNISVTSVPEGTIFTRFFVHSLDSDQRLLMPEGYIHEPFNLNIRRDSETITIADVADFSYSRRGTDPDTELGWGAGDIILSFDTSNIYVITLRHKSPDDVVEDFEAVIRIEPRSVIGGPVVGVQGSPLITQGYNSFSDWSATFVGEDARITLEIVNTGTEAAANVRVTVTLRDPNGNLIGRMDGAVGTVQPDGSELFVVVIENAFSESSIDTSAYRVEVDISHD